MQTWRLLALALALAAGPALAQPAQKAGEDALVEVKAKNVDHAYLLPGADFRPYVKVQLKGAEVAFQKGWIRSVSSGSANRLARVTEEDARKILEVARSGFNEIWAEVFRKQGFEVVTAPGEDVLQVAPSVVDLYINAPEMANTGRTRSYTLEAGEATLRLEVRESLTGALLGRVVDRREAKTTHQLQLTDGVTNASQFATLFARWAVIAAKGLAELKAASPLPETMQKGDRVKAK